MADVFNDKDTMDINELASLNDDISPELIEQLQKKLTKDAKNLSGEAETKPGFNQNDDTTLFEEPAVTPENSVQSVESDVPQVVQNDAKAEEEISKSVKKEIKEVDDNFIKKYKAKLKKQSQGDGSESAEETNTISSAAFPDSPPEDIEQVSNGKITERKLTPEQKSYNDSLDFLDGNIKYSKYVIYIDPQNVDFIDSLTVKERKNLINKILREQDDIAITKQRFKIIQTVIKHAIIAVLTIAISVPVVYWTINASLEATINNYRRSQSIFQTLYKKHGKISPTAYR